VQERERDTTFQDNVNVGRIPKDVNMSLKGITRKWKNMEKNKKEGGGVILHMQIGFCIHKR